MMNAGIEEDIRSHLVKTSDMKRDSYGRLWDGRVSNLCFRRASRRKQEIAYAIPEKYDSTEKSLLWRTEMERSEEAEANLGIGRWPSEAKSKKGKRK